MSLAQGSGRGEQPSPDSPAKTHGEVGEGALRKVGTFQGPDDPDSSKAEFFTNLALNLLQNIGIL